MQGRAPKSPQHSLLSVIDQQLDQTTNLQHVEDMISPPKYKTKHNHYFKQRRWRETLGLTETEEKRGRKRQTFESTQKKGRAECKYHVHRPQTIPQIPQYHVS